MERLFDQHLAAIAAEFRLRPAEFLQRHPATLPADDADFAAAFPGADLDAGIMRLCRHGVRGLGETGLPLASGPFDAVGSVIASALIDAATATREGSAASLPPLAPVEDAKQAFPRLLAQTCEARPLPDGRMTHIATRDGRPLVLLGALGVPAYFWSGFLADPEPGWRPVLQETRCGGLVEGGMASDAGLTTHAEDLAETLATLKLGPAVVMAWCNSGRVAVRLARIAPDLVDGLILIGTTFRGAVNAPPLPSPFEDNLERLFADVRRQPARAAMASRIMERIVVGSADVSDKDAAAPRFLGAPRAGAAGALAAPMLTAEALSNYARRTEADETHDTAADLRALTVPTLAITGDSDAIVNVNETAAAVSLIPGARHVEIVGAGHYLHDLQGRELRELMNRFFADRHRNPAAGRVRVRSFAH